MKDIIIEIYPKYGINETLNKLFLDITYKNDVQKMAQNLRLKRVNKYYTQDEIDYLKNNYSSLSIDVISKVLSKSKDSIIHKAKILHLNNDIHFYSEKDISYIKKYYNVLSINEIANHLNKSYSSVITKISKLGLSSESSWEYKDIEILKNIYPYYTNKKISVDFLPGRTPNAIRTMANKLDLKKTKEKSTHHYDRDDLLNNLRKAFSVLNRTPLGSELQSLGLPCAATFENYFGGYTKACIAAGIPINCFLYGKSVFSTSRKGVPCASKSEKLICDFLEDHNIEYIKEGYYKDYIQDDRCGNKRFDWIVGKYFIEYFGMTDKKQYSERVIEKIDLCEKHGIRLICLYRNDLKNLENSLHILLQ